MKLLHLVGAATVLSVCMSTAMAADASQLAPSGARAEVGTTGYGGALLWTANPYVGLALGYNGGDISWTDDLSVDGTKYDLDMENNNVYLNAELRPWGASTNPWAQGLYLAAGVAYLDNDYDLTQKSKDGTVKLNGNNYSYNGELNGKLQYENNIAPYFGLGFAPKINQNWGVFGEVGAYYTGNPAVDLDKDGRFINANGGSATADLRAEEQKIRNDDKYEWLPVGKVGVSFHW